MCIQVAAEREVAVVLLFGCQVVEARVDVLLVGPLRLMSLTGGQERQQRERCASSGVTCAAETRTRAVFTQFGVRCERPTAVGILMACDPIQCRSDGALTALRAAVSAEHRFTHAAATTTEAVARATATRA